MGSSFTLSSLGIRWPYDPRDRAPSVDDQERAQDYRDEEWRRFGFFVQISGFFLFFSDSVGSKKYRNIDQIDHPGKSLLCYTHDVQRCSFYLGLVIIVLRLKDARSRSNLLRTCNCLPSC